MGLLGRLEERDRLGPIAHTMADDVAKVLRETTATSAAIAEAHQGIPGPDAVAEAHEETRQRVHDIANDVTPPDPEQQGDYKWLPLGDGAIEAGVMGANARVGDLIYAASAIPEQVASVIPGMPDRVPEAMQQWREENFRPDLDLMFGSTEEIARQFSESTWENVKDTWKDSEGFLEKAGATKATIGYMAQTTLTSVPEMMAMVFAPYAYVATRTAEIAEDRQEHSGEPTSVHDLLIAGATATVVQKLDMLGLGSAGMLPGDVEKRIAKVVLDSSRKAAALRVGKAAAKGAAGESSTEAVQEYLEFVATQVDQSLGDIRSVATDPAVFDSMMAAAVGAAGMGVAGGTLSSVRDEGLGKIRKEEEQALADAPDLDEEGDASTDDTPLLPGPPEQLALPPPTDAERGIPEEPAADEQAAVDATDASSPADPVQVAYDNDNGDGVPGELTLVAPVQTINEPLSPDEQEVVDATDRNKQRALAAAETKGAELANTAIGKFVGQAVRGESAAAQGIPDPSKISETSAQQILQTLDNLARMTAALSRETKQANLVAKLEEVSKHFQDVRDVARQAMDNTAAGASPNQVTGALVNSAPLMDTLGLPGNDLLIAGKGDDIAAVRDALQAVNAAAKSAVQRSKVLTTPIERGPSKEDTAADRDIAAVRNANQDRGGTPKVSPEEAMRAEDMYTEVSTDEEGNKRRKTVAPADSPEAKSRTAAIHQQEQTEDRRKLGKVTNWQAKSDQYEKVEYVPDEFGGDPDPGNTALPKPTAKVLKKEFKEKLAATQKELEVLRKRLRTKGISKTVRSKTQRLVRATIDDYNQMKAMQDSSSEAFETVDIADTTDRKKAPPKSQKILDLQRARMFQKEHGAQDYIDEQIKSEAELGSLAAAAKTGAEDRLKKERTKVKQQKARDAADAEVAGKVPEKKAKVSKEAKAAEKERGPTTKYVLKEATEDGTAQIVNNFSGVSKARLQYAKKTFAKFTKAYSKTKKGLDPLMLVGRAKAAKAKTIAARGLDTIYVLNTPDGTIEETKNIEIPTKWQFVAIEGGYPKRDAPKRGADGRITSITRAKPRTFDAKAGFDAGIGKEFYNAEDVAVVRGRRVKHAMTSDKSNVVSMERKELPVSDNTMIPEESDAFLVYLGKQNFDWDGAPDEMAMAQYLLGRAGKGASGVSSNRGNVNGERPDNRTPTQIVDEWPVEEPIDPVDPEEPIDPEDDSWIDDLLPGLIPDPNAEYVNRRAILVEEIKELTRKIDAAVIELPQVEAIAEAAHVLKGRKTIETHAQWPWRAEGQETITAVLIDKKTIGDEFGFILEPRNTDVTIDADLTAFIMRNANIVVEGARKDLADLQAELEKLDETNKQRAAREGTRPTREPKTDDAAVDENTGGPEEDGADGVDGGVTRGFDDRTAGRVRLGPRTPEDPYKDVTVLTSRIKAAIRRARDYQFSGPGGLAEEAGLNETQVRGTGLLYNQWVDAQKAGFGGFLNIDNTGLGKSRQLAASADMIRKAEEKSGQHRPVVIITPGNAFKWRTEGGVRKTSNSFANNIIEEFQSMGLDPEHKYPNGESAYVYKQYTGMSGVTGATEYAGALADEGHAVKGTREWADGFQRLDTKFRAFFTATPTDMPGQELYYLAHMTRREGESYADARKQIARTLSLTLSGDENKPNEYVHKDADYDENAYIEALQRQLSPLVKKGAVVARTYGRAAKTWVTNLSDKLDAPILGSDQDSYLDQGAIDLYHELAAADPKFEAGPDALRLMEHAKIPYMLARAKERITHANYKNKVIMVFHHTNAAGENSKLKGKAIPGSPTNDHGDVLHTYDMSPITRMEYLVAELDIPSVTVAGESRGDTDVAAFEEFQGDGDVDGNAKLLIMSDSRGSEGLNLNDKWGDSPRYMMIAQTSRQGQRFLQLLGRHDRANNKTEPYTDFVKVDLLADRAYRQNIDTKINIQNAISGASAIDPDIEYHGEQIFQKKGFRERRKAKTIADSLDTTLITGLLDGTSTTDARSLVEQIARDADSIELRTLATTFLTEGSGWNNLTVGMLPKSEQVGEQTLGRYSGEMQHIEIGDFGGATQTLLHEVAHHFTEKHLETNRGAQVQLKAIMSAMLKANPELRTQYKNAFRDIHEFVSEFYSDAGLQAQLKKTYISKKNKLSMWDRIVRLFAGFIRVQSDAYNAYERVLDMDLLASRNGIDFDSMPLHKLSAPKLRAADTEELAAAEDKASKIRGWTDPRARGAWHKIRTGMLKTMTYHQIVDTYSRWTERDGGLGNFLKEMVGIQESITAQAATNNEKFQKEIAKPVAAFAQGEGRKMVYATMREGGPREHMTKLEFLARMMNISGENQLHFGRGWNDKTHRQAQSQAHSRVAWKMHAKKLRSKDMEETLAMYNRIADYFQEARRAEAHVVGGVYLDNIFPEEAGSWVNKSHAVVRAKLKAVSISTDEELAEIGGKGVLEGIKDMMNTGVVNGAYFPMRRYGDHVVTVSGEADYSTHEERDRLLAEHPASKDKPDSHKNAKSGTVIYTTVSRFETNAEAETGQADLVAQYADSTDTITVSGVMNRAESHQNGLAGTTFSALSLNFADRLSKRGLDAQQTKVLQTVFNTSLLDMLPDTSSLQSMHKRKGVAGASNDILRTLHHYGSSQGYRMANLQFSRQRTKLASEFGYFVSAMERQRDSMGRAMPRNETAFAMRQVLKEVTKREQASVDISQFQNKWGKRLNDVGFAYFLVGASYNVVNMTQVPLVAYPSLAARHGPVAAGKALAGAYKVTSSASLGNLVRSWGSLKQLGGAFKPIVEEFNTDNYEVVEEMTKGMSNPLHVKLIETMTKLGDISASLAMDMGRKSERSHIDKHGRPVNNSRIDYLTDWMRMAPHLVEVSNRSVTAVAAFDLEYAKNKSLPDKERYDKALAYARQTVNQTQFVYQGWNKPPAFQHPVGNVMLMFKQHVQHMYALMIMNAAKSVNGATPAEKSEARKALIYFVGMHVMAAGAVGGTPEPLKWLLGMAFGFWASEGEEPWEFDREVRDVMYEAFGPAGATMASHGLPGFVGVSLASRVGIDSMLLFKAPGMESGREAVGDAAMMLGGPMLGMAANTIDAINLAKQGDKMRALEKASPKALRDALRAKRFHEEGMTDLAGKQYLSTDHLNWFDYTVQALGFSPSAVADTYQARSVGFDRTRVEGKRRDLFSRLFKSLGTKYEADAYERIMRWNRDNPAFAISRAQVKASMKKRYEDQARTHKGVVVPKTKQAWAAEKLRSY